MPDKQTKKQKLIAKIIAMQQKSIRMQMESANDGEDDARREYNKEHDQLAKRVAEIAHREIGTAQ